MTRVSLDYETASAVPIEHGLDKYFNHPSARVLMCAFRIDGGPVHLWDPSRDGPFPERLRRLLLDPDVAKWAFNATFERLATRILLKIDTPYEGWRCTMALAYMRSFTGDLGDVGAQIGLPNSQVKSKDGRALIQMFSKPQAVTKTQPYEWRDHRTDPVAWARFRSYCVQDVVAEDAIRDILLAQPVADGEWELYELDQRINDAGLPINKKFVQSAIGLSDKRKQQLNFRLQNLTGADNPGSQQQMLAWLKQHGYPFNDLQKDTIVKVLNEDAEVPVLDAQARRALFLRQSASRMSVAKYDAVMAGLGAGDHLRHCFQFGGASRTLRWAGRRFQPTNLPRPPKILEDLFWLYTTTQAIEDGDIGALALIMDEPMDALVGCVRSAVSAPDEYEFRTCDLNAIESRVVGWATGCERLLNVFKKGLDPYKDFATDLFGVEYEDVTKKQRNDAKPAVLGCNYRLGGGQLIKGRKTGLWGYAEKMGINLSREEAEHAVKKFRAAYPEVEQSWGIIEEAAKTCVNTHENASVGEFMQFERIKGFLLLRLPSGRALYYQSPKIVTIWFASNQDTKEMLPFGTNERAAYEKAKEPGWKVHSKRALSHMGRPQGSKLWKRLPTHGGRLIENLTQAIARDVLKEGMLRAARDGFDIRLHVYDEICTLQRKDDRYHTLERLRDHMSRPIGWAPGLPLGAEGWTGRLYRK